MGSKRTRQPAASPAAAPTAAPAAAPNATAWTPLKPLAEDQLKGFGWDQNAISDYYKYASRDPNAGPVTVNGMTQAVQAPSMTRGYGEQWANNDSARSMAFNGAPTLNSRVSDGLSYALSKAPDNYMDPNNNQAMPIGTPTQVVEPYPQNRMFGGNYRGPRRGQ